MILDEIVSATKTRVENEKTQIPLEEMKALAKKPCNPFAFEMALLKNEIAFICEVKKASPSKGIIAENFPYIDIAKDYEKAGASAISVLTEPDFFMGSTKYLTQIKQNVSIPVLRKDFIIDEYQIYQASAIGADAILLICAILEQAELESYMSLAESLGLSCLVEAHDEQEVNMAIKAGARVIGVNNRNLKTFEVDINNSVNLRRLIPEDIIFVSESGISNSADIKRLRQAKVNAVLIGEQLMKSEDKKSAFESLRGIND